MSRSNGAGGSGGDEMLPFRLVPPVPPEAFAAPPDPEDELGFIDGGFIEWWPLCCDDATGGGGDSKRIVEWSKLRKSNVRTLPSAPTDAKTSLEAEDQQTS